MYTSPPKLLSGLALLYWGYLTGHMSAALPAAILLESRWLVNIRWDFKYESYIKAWNLCILCAVIIAMFSWIDGMRIGKLHTLFVWAPFILLPIELAQRFGTANQIPLSTFSIFARRKMLQDMKEGRKINPRLFNTGYPYITMVLLATAKASRHDLYHYVGLSLIIGICLYAYTRKNGHRPWSWATAFVLLLTISWLGQWGMYKMSRYYRGGSGQEIMLNQSISSSQSRTSIGRLGRIKANGNIVWRMKLHHGKKPSLIRAATYNQYANAIWTYSYAESDDLKNEYEESGYRSYSDASSLEGERDIRWFTEEAPQLSDIAPVTIIGEIDAKVEEHPLPVPDRFIAIGDLDKEAYVECNSLGTVRMANPNYNVVEYAIWMGDFANTEEPPSKASNVGINHDLHIPQAEAAGIESICQELNLYDKSLSTKTKINTLRDFFINHFEYSTHLTTPRFDRGKRQTSVSLFLEKNRQGHCEYFATATTLILREAGIPARYCIGYAVNERSDTKNEWVIRGLHAHAWSRVWIEQTNSNGQKSGKWIDVDLTPPSWLAMEAANTDHWRQRLADSWQRLSEDFLIWRTREDNKNKVYTVVAAILSLMAIWVFWRLWSSRQRKVVDALNLYQRPKNAPYTALHKLEPLVAKKIGHRPTGVPLCAWLRGLLKSDDPSLENLDKALLPAITLHSALRFDPAESQPEKHAELGRLSAHLRKQIKKCPSYKKMEG